MRTDVQIKEDILQELAWKSPDSKTQIGVIVKDGIVTLTGVVDSFIKKIEAERIAKRVYGVKALAEDLTVRLSEDEKSTTDPDIAKAIINTFRWNNSIPDDKIKIKVEDGWVYLSGEVERDSQRKAAKQAVSNLYGVVGVANNLTLKVTAATAVDIKSRITKAFERSATLDSKNIDVSVEGHTVTLSGTVHSLQEKDDARNAAFFAPGITKVINNLKVQYYPEYA